MTKKDFDIIFNKKLEESSSRFTDSNKLKERLLKASSDNNKISNEKLVAFAIIEAMSFSKDLVYSVLSEVLPFDD